MATFSKELLFRSTLNLKPNTTDGVWVKSCFFVTFNIILSHIFPENFPLKISKSFRRYKEFLCQSSLFSLIFINFMNFLTFLCNKEKKKIITSKSPALIMVNVLSGYCCFWEQLLLRWSI